MENVIIDLIDYTPTLLEMSEGLETIKKLQIMQINNSIEVLKIGFIVLGLVIAISVGALFLKLVFK